MTHCLSLHSRERGLKFRAVKNLLTGSKVAPLAGAWIEIAYFIMAGEIETVAPLAGAWIEIYTDINDCDIKVTSLHSRERGLK